MSVHAHRAEGVTGPERQEGSNGVRGGIGVGDGIGDGNGVGSGDGDEAGTGTAKKLEVNGEAQDRNEDGSGDREGAGVESPGQTKDGNGDGGGDGNESNSRGDYGDEDGNVNEDIIGEGGGEVKKRKKPHKTCRRHVGNGGDLGGKREKRRKYRVGPVAATPDNLEKNNEAGGGAQGIQGLRKICTSRESVSPLSRLVRGFRYNHY